MINTIAYNTQQNLFERVTSVDEIPDDIDEVEGHVYWLDLIQPGEQEMGTVAQKFHLHPLAIEDAVSEMQRAKIEEYDNFYFIVVFIAHLNETTKELELHELDLFVGPNYLITVHDNPLVELGFVERRLQRSAKKIDWGVGILLHTLLDIIIDRYIPVVDHMVQQAESLEDRIFAGVDDERETTLQLLELKKYLMQMRRVTGPELDVLKVLIHRDTYLFGRQISVYFRDIYDHLTRLTDTLDLYIEQLRTMMDVNISVASHKLNQVVRTLTSASIILMFNALIAGIYGMNFDFMPELHWRFGYAFAIGLMIVVSALLGVYFKRNHWF